MKVDRKQLKNLSTSYAPTVHTVKVDLHRLEELGLCELPIRETGPVKIDKKQLKLLASMPLPQTSVHGIKVDLGKLEEMGLYKKPDDIPDIAWYTMYQKPAFIAASFTIGVVGLCSLYVIFGSKTKSDTVDMATNMDQSAPIVTHVSNEEIEDLILTKLAPVPVEDVMVTEPASFEGVQNIFQRVVLDEQAAETTVDIPSLFTIENPVIETIPYEGAYIVSNEDTTDTDIDDTVNIVSNVSVNEGADEVIDKDADRTLDMASIDVSNTVLNVVSNAVSNVIFDSSSDEGESEELEEEGPVLVMVKDVQTSLSVRKEASDDSEKAGLLYKDCGGMMLDQKDGWTLIESGELTGWVKDDFLLFDEDAQEKADEVGELVATVEVDALNIRKEPDTDATILAVASSDDTFPVSEVSEDGWAEVLFKDNTAYISLDYADVEFQVPSGETMEVVEQREKEEKAAKEKAEKEFEAKKAAEKKAAEETEIVSEPAVTTITGEGVTLDDVGMDMLAAIIYCEAGNQPYDGQVAVGAVVVNRLLSPKFPNGIEEVLRAPRQFQPVSQGKFDRVYSSGSWSESAMNAAREAVAGNKVSVGNALYFKNPKIAGAHSGITIGDHVFW